MSINRVRAIVLGFLALLAVGSFGATAASAFPGPYWHHRDAPKEGDGNKIGENAPEQFQGEGGLQTLSSVIGTTNIVITSPGVQVKGIVYNNSLQGQIKLLLKYHEPLTIVEPKLKECEAKLGPNNEVKSEGHLMWKWDGTLNQLKQSQSQEKLGQKWDIVFTPSPLLSGATTLPKGLFTNVTLSGAGCGLLAGKFEVKESQSVIPKPSQVKEWSRTLTTTFPGWGMQHFWNGTEVVGAKGVGLTFGGNPASLKGIVEAITDIQEISVFEQ